MEQHTSRFQRAVKCLGRGPVFQYLRSLGPIINACASFNDVHENDFGEVGFCQAGHLLKPLCPERREINRNKDLFDLSFNKSPWNFLQGGSFQFSVCIIRAINNVSLKYREILGFAGEIS